jgi:CRP-like cAMP-binding protein
MATLEQGVSEKLLDTTAEVAGGGLNEPSPPIFEDAGTLCQGTGSTSSNSNESEKQSEPADGRLFTQSVRDKDQLAEFRAAKIKLKQQRMASVQAALDANNQKESEQKEIKKKGLDGSADHIRAQLTKERTEITMQVSDHKAERLKRFSTSFIAGKKKDVSDDFFNVAMSASNLPELQKACWEVTNFVPLKVHNTQLGATTEKPSVREVTEDKSVLNALKKLFELLEGFCDQTEQFLSMLSEDPEVAVISVPAGARTATKGQPMTRSLVLLSGQAHSLSYAGESHILLEESQSTRMTTGDCLGFINDNEDIVQENAFTIICQTSCSFLEIPKSSLDTIFAHMKMERFIAIMSLIPEDRIEADVQFLLTFAKKNAFFKQLKESRQLNLCRQAKMEMFQQEDVLFNEDDRGQTYYIIIRGSVRVSKNVGGALDNQGNKIFIHVALLSQGVGFGELALLSTSGVRQATVTANEDCVFMTLNRRIYNDVLRSEHEHSLQETMRAVMHVFPYVAQRDKIFQTYIAQLFRDEELPAGRILTEQGAKANTFYILKEGTLAVDHRVEYSRFSAPEDAGLEHMETPFETKTLKKFSQKEYKTRVVPFGEMSHFGDTVGDVDMLADPIWAATYMYRTIALKPVVVCSISWSALKVRFPHEMMDELRTRSLKKFNLFKSIFDSAVATEFSNSQFSCLSVFNPAGYVPSNFVVEKSKSSIKASISEMLDGKKMMLRRKIRNRMDVPVSEAFQTTVNEWIADMSRDNVLQSIEIESDSIKRKTGVQLAASELLFGNENVKKDKALQAMMRSAFMDEQNVDQCIDNIIKMTREELSSDDESEIESDLDATTTSQKLTFQCAESGVISPNSSRRSVGSPIPGHKPQFVRYDLTNHYCNTAEGLVENMDNIVLLDSSVVQTRPSSRAVTLRHGLSSRSKSRHGVGSRQGTAASIGNIGDREQDCRYFRPNVDGESSDASPEQLLQVASNDEDDDDIPEYFYPDHYRIKSSTKKVQNRANEFRKRHECKQQRARSATKIDFDSAVIATPIKLQSMNANIPLSSPAFSFRRSRTPTPLLENLPLPPTDKGLIYVKHLPSAPAPLIIRRVAKQTPTTPKPSTAHSVQLMRVRGNSALGQMLLLPDIRDCRYADVTDDNVGIDYIYGQYVADQPMGGEEDLPMHTGMVLSSGKALKVGAFVPEKESTWSSGFSLPAQNSTFSDGLSDDEHIHGTTCSPDVQTLPVIRAIPAALAPMPTPPVLSKEEVLQQILKSGFLVNSRKKGDADSAKEQAKEVERLVKERAQAETKSKISNLLSAGMLDNKIKHLEAEKPPETVDFELSEGLLQKMHDVTVRRMNDPNFKGQQLINIAPKQSSGMLGAKKIKKHRPAATPKTFDFNGFDQSLSPKSKKFEEAMNSSYHNEQMLKMQHRNTDHHKAERLQLLKNVLSKSSRGPSMLGLNIESVVLLPSIASASPLQQKR